MKEIPEVTDLDMAFGSTKDLPPMEEIPEEFKNPNAPTKWNDLFSQLFYKGGDGISFNLKDGVDGEKVMRWYRAHACSFKPKHEHKEAGIAYRLSQWLDDWTIDKDGHET